MSGGEGGATALTVSDPGPMARFEALVREDGTMGVIVQRIAEGETLRQLAVAWRVPAGRLAQWIIEDRNRNELYINACAIRETFRTDEIHALADDVKDKLGLGIANLRLKAIQWAAAKWNPARFGDSSHVSVAVRDERMLDRDAQVLELARGVGFLLQAGADIAARREPVKQLAAPIEAEPADTAAPAAPAVSTQPETGPI